MKLVILASILCIILFPLSVKSVATILLSIGWLIYAIYYFIKLLRIKDKKIVVKDYINYLPNNNYSYLIRYLYKGKVDNKVFVSTILELIQKKSISLIRQHNEYYLIDNKVIDEELTKNELIIKRILFKNIGSDNSVLFKSIQKNSKLNSRYFYELYKDWQNTFIFECAKHKYFKSIKPIIDNSLFYFIISFVIAIYNALFTKYILIALFIFYITVYLIYKVNNLILREDEAKVEYTSWLKFKRYISKNDNNFKDLDIYTLENYAMYAYVLDEYSSFLKILNEMYSKDEDIFNDSVMLSIMNCRIFDDMEIILNKSIKTAKINSIVFFAKNRGRRI